MKVFSLAVAFLLIGSITRAAPAALYLNGGILSVNSPTTGANTGGALEWDSFNTANSDLRFNGVTGSPILLNVGSNTFTLAEDGPVTSNNGLGLMFTTNNTLITAFGTAPDLYVFVKDTGGFAYPAAGTSVATLGQFSGDAPYSGATSFSVDGQLVTVSAWDGTNLTLNLVPEPGSATTLAAAVCGGLLRRRRIRR